MALLYRGVTQREDELWGGQLRPKGNNREVAILADGRFLSDGKAVAGESSENVARAHQFRSGLYDGACVSFTRCPEVAATFGTSFGREPGWIYVVDDRLLELAAVQPFEFSDPEHPLESEVSLLSPDGGPLPMAIVIEKYAVDASGKRLPAE